MTTDTRRGPQARGRRRRPTEADREATQRTASIAASLGRDVRDARRRLGITQAALGERVGLHQTWVSDVELGKGGPMSLDRWVRLGVVLGRPLAVSLSRPIGELHGPADAGHLEMQEALLAMAAAIARSGHVERPSRPDDPRHATDVAIRDEGDRTLILVEVWNTFGDVGAAVRSTDRKVAEARSTITDGWRVATVWVVRPTSSNRATVSRYPHLFRTAFPGSSLAWVAALLAGSPAPERPGLVWFDPVSRRLTPWRAPRLRP